MQIKFLNKLTTLGYRVFDVSIALNVGDSLGLNRRSVHHVLSSLTKKELIHPIRRGLYVVQNNIMAGAPIHKFEIALALSPDGAIGFWSALVFHGLSDQILNKVFVMHPAKSGQKKTLSRIKVEGYEFQLIQIQPKDIWGIEKKTLEGNKIHVTDLERTLLDGLSYPQYCGGFREVLSSFSIAFERININKIVQYAGEMPVVVRKRLGWILESLGARELTLLKVDIKSTYYDKLDPTGRRKGKYNKNWMLVENF